MRPTFRFRVSPLTLFAACLLASLGGPPARAEQPASPDLWIGKRVITTYGTVLQVKDQVVDDADRGKNLARGKDQNTHRVYKVKHVNGPWLWLVAENSGAKGWAPAANVIPFEQAVDYITGLIRANPGDASNYSWRGNVWKDRGS
jgi:hypothetical protein